MKTCKQCVYWSEMLARSEDGYMEAHCFQYNRYMGEIAPASMCRDAVLLRELLGAIDDPRYFRDGEEHPCSTEEFEALRRLAGPKEAAQNLLRELGMEEDK